MIWNGWPLARVLVLFVGLAFMMIFIQVTLLHYRQNFRHWAQWLPVIGTPLFGIAALIFVLINQLWINWVLTVLLVIGFAAGVLGFILHFRGVGERVDGYRLNNFLVGPPIIMPLIVSTISVLGLIVLLWR